MTTPAVEFLPGDRVVTAGRQSDKGLKGTVTSQTANGAYVCWDGDLGSVVMRRGEFERQPIEPGCSVRWKDQYHTTARGDITGNIVDKVISRVFFTGTAFNVALDDVVRIATDPITWTATINGRPLPPTPPHDMEELREGIRQAADMLGTPGRLVSQGEINAWIARFAPLPEFKRGQLVSVSNQPYNTKARIVGLDDQNHTAEIMFVEHMIAGTFKTVAFADLTAAV
jgi:hypothetical protein